MKEKYEALQARYNSLACKYCLMYGLLLGVSMTLFYVCLFGGKDE